MPERDANSGRAAAVLECRRVAVSYGHHRALQDVSLRVDAEEIVVILGANGAGKTTLLNAIAGRVPVAEPGRIEVDGRQVANRPPHEIVEAGLALVPEGRGIFGDLSVRENLLLGAHARRARSVEARNLERVLSLFPRLGERSGQIARTMSGGEQQMVAIGRALMSAPRILMLDEPSLGLSPLLCAELFKALAEVRRNGVGILLVEQNARQGLAIADRGYLLENGRVVGEGAAAALASDPAVQRAYLGGGERAQAVAVGAAAPPQAEAERPAAAQAPLAGQARGAATARDDAARTAGDAAMRAVFGVAAWAPASRRAEALISQSIEVLASRAAAIGAEHVRLARQAGAAGSGASPPPPAREAGGVPGGSLEDAIAGIEEAAARALRGSGRRAPAGGGAAARINGG